MLSNLKIMNEMKPHLPPAPKYLLYFLSFKNNL